MNGQLRVNESGWDRAVVGCQDPRGVGAGELTDLSRTRQGAENATFPPLAHLNN